MKRMSEQNLGIVHLTLKGLDAARNNYLSKSLTLAERGFIDMVYMEHQACMDFNAVLEETISSPDDVFFVYQNLKQKGYLR